MATSNNTSLFVSSVANDRPGAVVNITVDPTTGAITSATPNFTPGNSSILKYDETGSFLKTLVDPGVLSLTSGMTFGSDGYLYANDQGYAYTVPDTSEILYGRVLRFNPYNGELINDNGGEGFIPASILTAQGLLFPEDIVFGPDGDIYVSGLGGGGVQRFDGKTGAYKSTVASTNSKNQELIAAGLNFGPDGNLYISSVLNDNSILRYNPNDDSVTTFIPSSIAEQVPSGSVFTPDGQKLLNGTFLDFTGLGIDISQYSSVGSSLGFFVNPSNNAGLQSASRLIFGNDKNLYVSDFAGSQIIEYDGQTGDPVQVFVSSDTITNGGLKNPGGLRFQRLNTPKFDSNGDGKGDILWRNSTTGQNAIWQLDGSNLIAGDFIPSLSTEWKVGEVGDFGGDGKSDIFWRNSTTGQNAIWQLDGSSLIAGDFIPSLSTDWKVGGVNDFGGDSKSDIFWRNTVTGQNAIWQLDGSSLIAGDFISGLSTEWVVGGVDDFGGDGKSDIFWRNTVTGQNAIWQLDGSGLIAGDFISGLSTDWVVGGVGDFGGDGKSDIFWRNTVTGQNAIWQLDGSSLIAGDFISGLSTEWAVGEVSDFGGDGRADILWRNTVTGQNAIWQMNGSSLIAGDFISSLSNVWQVSN